jgi:hypothetical protein
MSKAKTSCGAEGGAVEPGDIQRLSDDLLLPERSARRLAGALPGGAPVGSPQQIPRR